ncbi:MAG: putative cytosolic protein [Verrucomicrobiales bacterium]|nr:putative cytosolic protein [Verrucomicrobiales bacterium]
MLDDTLSKLETRIQNAGTLRDDNRAELLQLIAQLKTEVSGLSETHEEQAQSIASFAELSTHEAMRENKNPETLKHSTQGLASSVDEFEKTHPQLVGVVNRIATTLSNMGI